MTDVPVPESIKKFVLENSKMDSVGIVSSLCGESFMQDLCCQQHDVDHQDDSDFISDCSTPGSETTLHSLQPPYYDYSIPSEPHDYMVTSPASVHDVNNNTTSQYHYDYQYGSSYGIHGSHGTVLYRTDYSPVDYHQHDRVEPYRDDSYENYDSDVSVEFSSDIITTSSIYPNLTVKHEPNRDDRLPSFVDIFKTSPRHSKGNRGRPVTYLRPGSNFKDSDASDVDDDDKYTSSIKYSSPKVRRGAKNILLWKFLLEELGSKHATHVQWVNRKEGTFKFVDTAECSKLWGLKKKKDDMNFEKLSRGIRHYYRDGLMSRLDGTRLVYKFNWDRVPKSFRKFARGS